MKFQEALEKIAADHTLKARKVHPTATKIAFSHGGKTVEVDAPDGILQFTKRITIFGAVFDTEPTLGIVEPYGHGIPGIIVDDITAEWEVF